MITRKMARRQMPKPPRQKGVITKGMARAAMPKVRGITAKQAAMQAGRRLRASGVRIGTKPVKLAPGANIANYVFLMRGAGYAVRKEDLRRKQ